MDRCRIGSDWCASCLISGGCSIFMGPGACLAVAAGVVAGHRGAAVRGVSHHQQAAAAAAVCQQAHRHVQLGVCMLVVGESPPAAAFP